MIAQVIVDVVHSNVARPFTYAVPAGMALQAGMRVSAPLGRRQVCGVVVAVHPDSELPPDLPQSRLRPITHALDEYAAILPPLLALAEEIALETHCPLAEALRLMLPAAMRAGRIGEKKQTWARLNPGADVQAAILAQKRAPKRVTLLRLLSDGQKHSVDELSQLVTSPREGLKRLQADGYCALWEEEVFRLPYAMLDGERTKPPELTDDQRQALGLMRPALQEGRGAFLLHGVTGSGKTEVFLALAQDALDMDKSVIILVPEIALTPQMVDWFRRRFGETTAVLHSHLTDGERYDEWRRIRLGKARVVIGARSAVFAPVERLGLIVVDEEHEQTYLSDKHPRYDARKVAKSRCEREGAALVLSSATPSVLSFAMAQRGDYTLVEMPRRVRGRSMPQVAVVDMRQELAAGNRSIFSLMLQQKLKACLERGEQAMLFINRRGYSSFVSCRQCGYVVKCPQCDLSMTLHHVEGKPDGLLRCHMCGAAMAPPKVCPECGSSYIRYFGSGTQRVQDEMQKLYPKVRTLRMDIDTTQKRDAHEKLLSTFRAGEAQVLIGTQMIAKGLDFPAVTLVGVVAADLTLNLPDYRAQERTFQLITQVAGRAGRARLPGEVVVQTYKPEDPCIQAAAAQDYRQFFTEEFHKRRARLYPPFTSLTRLLVEGDTPQQAEDTMKRLHETVNAYLAAHPAQKKRVLMIRADEAPVKLIRGKARYHVLMKLFEHPDAQPLLAYLSELAGAEYDGCQVYLEIDPATLM